MIDDQKLESCIKKVNETMRTWNEADEALTKAKAQRPALEEHTTTAHEAYELALHELAQHIGTL